MKDLPQLSSTGRRTSSVVPPRAIGRPRRGDRIVCRRTHTWACTGSIRARPARQGLSPVGAGTDGGFPRGEREGTLPFPSDGGVHAGQEGDHSLGGARDEIPAGDEGAAEGDSALVDKPAIQYVVEEAVRAASRSSSSHGPRKERHRGSLRPVVRARVLPRGKGKFDE